MNELICTFKSTKTLYNVVHLIFAQKTETLSILEFLCSFYL